MKKWLFIACTIISVVILLHVANERKKYVYYTLTEKIKEADVIMVGEINKVRVSRIWLNTAYVTPMRFIKGESIYKNKPIEYGSYIFTMEDYTDFEKGKSYVLFLKLRGDMYYGMSEYASKHVIGNDNKVSNDKSKIVPLDSFIEEIRNVIIEVK